MLLNLLKKIKQKFTYKKDTTSSSTTEPYQINDLRYNYCLTREQQKKWFRYLAAQNSPEAGFYRRLADSGLTFSEQWIPKEDYSKLFEE